MLSLTRRKEDMNVRREQKLLAYSARVSLICRDSLCDATVTGEYCESTGCISYPHHLGSIFLRPSLSLAPSWPRLVPFQMVPSSLPVRRISRCVAQTPPRGKTLAFCVGRYLFYFFFFSLKLILFCTINLHFFYSSRAN